MIGTKILDERNSKYNGRLRVVKTFGLGTYIQANGLTQSGGIVEVFWKQTFKVLRSKSLVVDNCLVLGLGGGTVVKLARENWPKARIKGVDIDPLMIELGKKYLGLNNLEVEIKIGDAFKELKKSKEKFDLIIIDLYRGDKYPEEFENERYIGQIKDKLRKDGIAIFNRLYYGEKRPQAVKFGSKLEMIFSKVDWFYPEANLMFICSKR
jgi:spermidine synthase